MIYQIPALTDEDRSVLGMIEDQRTRLRYIVQQAPLRWQGFMRRNTFARAIQGSNSIEGYNANLAEAVEIVDDEKPNTVEEETHRALTGHRNAMTYVLQSHNDPHFVLNAQVIKMLHYMMINYDMTKMPGQWRPGSIYVVHEPTNEVVYEGPDAELVPDLIEKLIRQIQESKDVNSLVLGAMAHLNLTMIHPFKDGNGRMARAIQTLVMARDGILSPIFSSIEEWLGRNTLQYYNILASVGKGKWNPQHDAAPWVRFCLVAHYQQCATLIKRNNEVGQIWEEIQKIIRLRSLPDRSELALMDATFGYRVRNNKYRSDNDVSDVVASRDLKKLSDAGLLIPKGEKRGRYYIAGEELIKLRNRFRDTRRAENPYDILLQHSKHQNEQLGIPGLLS